MLRLARAPSAAAVRFPSDRSRTHHGLSATGSSRFLVSLGASIDQDRPDHKRHGEHDRGDREEADIRTRYWCVRVDRENREQDCGDEKQSDRQGRHRELSNVRRYPVPDLHDQRPDDARRDQESGALCDQKAVHARKQVGEICERV